jgi:hypothetical protein
MNVIAGIVIGLIAGDWATAAGYSLAWAIIHVAYGRLFGLHRNPVVESTRGGNPVASYFIARFSTGFITALVVSLLTLLIVSAF